LVVSTRANLVTAVKPKIRLTDLSRVCPSSYGGDAALGDSLVDTHVLGGRVVEAKIEQLEQICCC
jgi:hypothetical protein